MSATPKRAALVVGGSRGIGLEIVKALLLSREFERVHTTVRGGADASRVASLGAVAHLLDVTNQSHHQLLAGALSSSSAAPIVELYHSAGTHSCHKYCHAVNAEAPFALLQSLLPTLRHAHAYTMTATPQQPRPRYCIVTSGFLFGSKAVNRTMHSPYSKSKAMANARVRDLAPQLYARDGLLLLAIHPGSVKTAMNPRGSSTPPVSAAGVIRACRGAQQPADGVLQALNDTVLRWNPTVVGVA